MRTNLRKLLDLMEKVVEAESCPRPPFRWHFRDGPGSSGTTYYDRSRGIAVTLGTDHLDAKFVVLHELAHWLTPEDRGHGSEFWQTAFRLYRAEGIGWASIHRSECCLRNQKGAHKMHLEMTRVGASSGVEVDDHLDQMCPREGEDVPAST